MGLYYEDVHVGQVFESPGRTITETDVVNFAAYTGDWNQLHTNEVYARETMFGRRVVHGLLGLAVAVGFVSRMGLFEGTTLAMLGIKDWTFKAPVFIGDTVRVRITITHKRVTSRGDRGILDRRFELINQDGVVCQEGNIGIMVKLRNPVEEAADRQ